MTLFLKNMPMNALVVLTEAARRSPDDFLPFNNLGAILNNFGQYEMALILLRYADELSPDNAMVLSNLGVTELDGAVRRRRKGLPESPRPGSESSRSQLRSGHVERAAE